MKTFCFQNAKFQNSNLQCSDFIEILDMIISGPTEFKTY